MIEKSDSKYDSFLFWRQPIVSLELWELEEAGQSGGQPASNAQGKKKMSGRRSQEEEVVLPEYSSFNYWRAPIASVDSLLADLSLLL